MEFSRIMTLKKRNVQLSIIYSMILMVVDMKVVPKKAPTSINDLYTLELKMPNVLPVENDEYICTGINLTMEDLYIKRFQPNADSTKIHHIIIYGCKSVTRSHLFPNHWPCSHSEICPGMQIVYAWGRNAPPLQLPPDVGFHVGPQSGINYLVLQAHYAHPLPNSDSSGVDLIYTIHPQPYIAGIFLMASSWGLIPPNQPKSHVDVNCRLDRDPINVFAYRVHAHALGTVISGYRYSPKKRKWDLIAKGNPQWPQAFYPRDQVMRIESEDIITLRCTYNSTTRKQLTRMGSTAGDEMCNLYLMYYSENPLLASDDGTFRMDELGLKKICDDVQFPGILANLPSGNDEPLPKNITLEQSAMGQHSNHQHFEHSNKKMQSTNDNVDYNGRKKYLELSQDLQWPFGNSQFGQITAIDFDEHGNIVIFHRGKHVWNELSFDMHNNFLRVLDGPINESTIVTIDPKTKQIISKWGENLFFLPHGLTIDHKNHSVWLTDVAMHQVLKYSIDPSSKYFHKPLLTLGQRFKPGKDEQHFCKPTSVAVDHSNGDFYVADGYCNSRIIRFSHDGKFLNHWGHEPLISDRDRGLDLSPNAFNIPHKVILVESNVDDGDDGEKLACVSDRENGRVSCFQTPHGQFEFQIRLPLFNGRVFSIAYSKIDQILYVVNGPSLFDAPGVSSNVLGFAFDFPSRQPLATFAPKTSGTFSQPHDIAVSPSGSEVFVVEIGPNHIWKFINNAYDADSVNGGETETKDGYSIKMSEKSQLIQAKPLAKNQSDSGLILKSKMIDQNLKTRNPSMVDETLISSGIGGDGGKKINYAIEMLRLRTKEFKEKVWSNNLLYFALIALFIFIIVINYHNSSSQSFRLCSLMSISLLRSIRKKFTNKHTNHSDLNGSSSSSGERLRLSDVLKKARMHTNHTNRDKRGFNRLPQNEEESDLVINHALDSDSDSDVLEDFNMSLRKNNNNNVI